LTEPSNGLAQPLVSRTIQSMTALGPTPSSAGRGAGNGGTPAMRKDALPVLLAPVFSLLGLIGIASRSGAS
jgi:hypothetical protein